MVLREPDITLSRLLPREGHNYCITCYLSNIIVEERSVVVIVRGSHLFLGRFYCTVKRFFGT